MLRLPSSVHEDLVRMAAMEGVSLNQYMVAALSRQVGRDEVLMKEKKTPYKAEIKSGSPQARQEITTSPFGLLVMTSLCSVIASPDRIGTWQSPA